MASPTSSFLSFVLLLLPIHAAAFHSVAYPVSNRRSLILVKQELLVLPYHHGPLLKGNLTVHLLFYGRFSPSQIASISDFFLSLSSSPAPLSVASWWATTASYRGGAAHASLAPTTIDTSYSLGRRITPNSLRRLARRVGPRRNSSTIAVVLTADDVTIDGFCMSRCGFHAAARDGGRGGLRFPYIWVGNAAAQCPGQCAWPFALPAYGPPAARPLVAPSGDVGVDGMVINLATLMAGVVTNPYGDGYFQGPAAAPLEAVTACTGIFGSGAYPGYPGKLLVDRASGASYNAQGLNGRRYLLPAMWDPKTSICATLV
ncbi:hypothetical protein HPP92_004280 [Vanilla planifolia]|uniref:Protein EXORDIUM-like 2 n=1 Tax=Vanilla planifolia TaxID=51239 RepID=A0A835S1H1_VANPL|nr:hypothetical protein HPP92_004280 [Vanilla planifolia]